MENCIIFHFSIDRAEMLTQLDPVCYTKETYGCFGYIKLLLLNNVKFN